MSPTYPWIDTQHNPDFSKVGKYGKEFTEAERKNLKRDYPEIYAQTRWNLMKRNPDAYVKGRISHADHGTIILPTWHQVVMNTEHRAKAMIHVSFLD